MPGGDMCLLSIAWQCSAEFPFVFAGNRDEYHARPSAAAHWWDDAPGVLGGRDLVAGGSWLGISHSGRFAVVTNQPVLAAPVLSPLSRGALVADWLKASDGYTASDLQATLDERNSRYGGFNLLTASLERDSTGTLHCFAGGNGSGSLHYEQLAGGIIGLSNTSLTEPWPKLIWLNRELSRLVAAGVDDFEQLFALLQRDEPVPGADSRGVPARPFVKGTEYGTRCSTVITIDRAGHCRFRERRFGAGGAPVGESAFEFVLTG